MTTKVITGTYKKNKMFCVYEEDNLNEDGTAKENTYAVVQFGIKKAKAILDHIEELKQFVEDNG